MSEAVGMSHMSTSKSNHAHDAVHGRTKLVAHVREKRTLSETGGLGDAGGGGQLGGPAFDQLLEVLPIFGKFALDASTFGDVEPRAVYDGSTGERENGEGHLDGKKGPVGAATGPVESQNAVLFHFGDASLEREKRIFAVGLGLWRQSGGVKADNMGVGVVSESVDGGLVAFSTVPLVEKPYRVWRGSEYLSKPRLASSEFLVGEAGVLDGGAEHGGPGSLANEEESDESKKKENDEEGGVGLRLDVGVLAVVDESVEREVEGDIADVGVDVCDVPPTFGAHISGFDNVGASKISNFCGFEEKMLASLALFVIAAVHDDFDDFFGMLQSVVPAFRGGVAKFLDEQGVVGDVLAGEQNVSEEIDAGRARREDDVVVKTRLDVKKFVADVDGDGVDLPRVEAVDADVSRKLDESGGLESLYAEIGEKLAARVGGDSDSSAFEIEDGVDAGVAASDQGDGGVLHERG